MKNIFFTSEGTGWVLKAQTKRLLSLAGSEVPQFLSASNIEEALRFARGIGYPVIGKIVSPKLVHK